MERGVSFGVDLIYFCVSLQKQSQRFISELLCTASLLVNIRPIRGSTYPYFTLSSSGVLYLIIWEYFPYIANNHRAIISQANLIW